MSRLSNCSSVLPGATARTLRQHQVEMDELANSIIHAGSDKRSITLDCTPGGGKTGSGCLLATRLLDAGLIDGVLWLVPRLSLAGQVADSFASWDHLGRHLEIVDGRDVLFAPALPGMPQSVGCVTTYQSVAHGRNYHRFREAVAGRRTLIIFDEVQFLNDDLDRGWLRKVQEVRDAAKFELLMSGTLWRTDNRRIPFITYERRDDGRLFALADITYGLRDAVRERAVLPTEWHNLGGVVQYQFNGQEHILDMLEDNGDEESRVTRTFLECDASVHRLLDGMVDHWRQWCRERYTSRLLVMADDTANARRWRTYLQGHHGISCTLATSREEAAGRNLAHFRERRQGQCLVTVAMAYVGFDCPDLTHLAYLSTARAPSWMLQSAARVSRFDARAPLAYEHQHAFVFAPDDARVRAFAQWMRVETNMGIRERICRTPNSPGTPPIVPPEDFEPLAADPSRIAVESLTGRLDPDTVDRLESVRRTIPYADKLTTSQLHDMLRGLGYDLRAIAR